MLIDGGAFVVGIAGAIPRRRNGLAWRSARGLRAGQSDDQSLLSPRNEAGLDHTGSTRSKTVNALSVRSRQEIESNRGNRRRAKCEGREMGRGSLSIFIVAMESRVTHPKEPVIIQQRFTSSEKSAVGRAQQQHGG